MIKFFRKIRYDLMEKNKTGKYLKYAIGEIILVVIGILIALSINNWNENQKAITLEKNYIHSIYKDLKYDLKKIDANLKTLSNQYTIGIEVLKTLELKDSQVIDSVRIATNIGWILSEVVPVEREENTWDKLRVLGGETFIINDSLTSVLNRFYTKFDGQIERFNQLPKKIRQNLRELTGNCHDAKGLKAINKNGIDFYGASSPYLRHCILSIEKTPDLVAGIVISAIFNNKIYEDLIKDAEAIILYLEHNFDFLNSETQH